VVEEGIIIEVTETRARVIVRRSEMCEECQGKGVCKSLGGGNDMEAEALNRIGAKVGDRVLLQLDTSFFLKIAFIVYMVPVLALIGGAVAGLKLGPAYAFEPELGSVLFGFGAFSITFLIIYLIGVFKKARSEHIPEIVKILPLPAPELIMQEDEQE